MKINPKVFNGIFRRLNYYDESTENYSLLVEEIIEISPAYNADKSSAKLRKARKQKEGLPKPEPQPYPQHEPEQSYDREHSVELCDYVQVPTMHKKKTSYVDELDPIDYIKRNT